MGWRPTDLGSCRPALFWDALKGLNKARNIQREFSYNLTRMATAELVNIQLPLEDRLHPSQLWPDWNSDQAVVSPDTADPGEIIEITRSSINFLNNR